MTGTTHVISTLIVGCAALLILLGDAVSQSGAVSTIAVNTSETTTSQCE